MPGRGSPGCLKSPTPANGYATRTSSAPESPASTPPVLVRQPRASRVVHRPPAANNHTGNSAYMDTPERITFWAVQPRPDVSRSSFFSGNSRIPDPAASRDRARVRSVGCQLGCQISDRAERRFPCVSGSNSKFRNGGSACPALTSDSVTAGSSPSRRRSSTRVPFAASRRPPCAAAPSGISRVLDRRS